jgi:hypothetical protein
MGSRAAVSIFMQSQPDHLRVTREHRIDHGATGKPYGSQEDANVRNYAAEQVMSCPQHNGDLIFPWPFGHFEICTSFPSSSFKVSLTSGASHFPQVAFTLIPQIAHS